MKKLLLTLTIASSFMISGVQAEHVQPAPAPTEFSSSTKIVKIDKTEKLITFLKVNNITPEQFKQALFQDELACGLVRTGASFTCGVLVGGSVAIVSLVAIVGFLCWKEKLTIEWNG